MATEEKAMDTEKCDDTVLAQQIIKILNHTSESLNDIELSTFLKLLNQLGKEPMTPEEVKSLILKCTEMTLFKEGMTVHLTKQTVRSLIEINQDRKLWNAVWKDISRLAGPLNFSYLADFGEIDQATLEKYMDLLQHGTENVRHIRLMVVGMFGVGKTTIIKRLCNQDASNVESTVGIDVSVNACEVNDKRQWKVRDLKAKPKKDFKRRMKQAIKIKPKKHAVNRSQEIKFEEGTVTKESSPESAPKEVAPIKERGEKEIRVEMKNHDVTKNAQSRPKADLKQNKENVRNPIKFDNKKVIEDVREAFGDDKEDETENRLTTVSTWDFAGQSIYYSTHHFFLSARAIYLLVLDISKKLSDEVQEDKDDRGDYRATSMPKGFTCLDAFKFWMNSIYTYTAARKDPLSNYRPKIVLVGTFKDSVKENFPEESKQDGWLERYKEDYFNKALESFIDTEVIKLVHPTKFFVSKDDPVEIFNILKEELTDIAEKQPFWDEIVAMSWLPLERAIELRKDETKSTETGSHDRKNTIMELHELKEIDEKTEYPLSDKQLFKLFLNFQHALGNVLYYDTEELEDIIILDPQWILDVFKLFVTHVKAKQPTQLDEWKDYERNAILSQQLIDELINQNGEESFQKYKQKIIHYMEYLDVIAKPVIFDEESDETSSSEDEGAVKQTWSKSRKKDFYIVPCLLSEKPPEEVLRMKTSVNAKSTPILCLVFTNKFLPAFVCHRLMATCIRKWQVPLLEDNQLMLFNGMGRFLLNRGGTSWLDLRWKDYIVYMQISRCSKIGKSIDGKHCDEVRKQIKKMIDQIFSIHRNFTGNMVDRQRVQYDEYIKCPECNANESDFAKLEGDIDCAALSDAINVKKFEKSEEVNCAKYHTITRDEALSCWYSEENHEYKDRWIRDLRGQVYEWLKGKQADLEVTNGQVAELSMYIGKEYIALGIELGLTFIEIEHIEMEAPNTRTCIQNILMKWKKSSVIPPTVAVFKSAFERILDFRYMNKVDRTKEIVKWYEKKGNPTDSPQEKELIEVIHVVGRRYKRLANMLFERHMYAEIEQVEMDYSLDFNRTLKILLMWKKEAENVTFTFLKDCLVKTFKMDWDNTKKRIAEDEEQAKRAVERKNIMEDKFPIHRQLPRERQDLEGRNRVTDMEGRMEDNRISDSREELLYSRQQQVQD